jgi:hypothetical protein
MRKNPGGSKGSIINTASFVAILGAATPQIACRSNTLDRLVVHLELSGASGGRLSRQEALTSA